MKKHDKINRPETTYSRWASFFDEACFDWTKDPCHNLMFLRRQQDRANKLLKERGYVTLNEVYELLGIPKRPDAQYVGWLFNQNKRISFGIYDADSESARNFVNGRTDSILLDFNIDSQQLPIRYLDKENNK